MSCVCSEGKFSQTSLVRAQLRSHSFNHAHAAAKIRATRCDLRGRALGSTDARAAIRSRDRHIRCDICLEEGRRRRREESPEPPPLALLPPFGLPASTANSQLCPHQAAARPQQSKELWFAIAGARESRSCPSLRACLLACSPPSPPLLRRLLAPHLLSAPSTNTDQLTKSLLSPPVAWSLGATSTPHTPANPLRTTHAHAYAVHQQLIHPLPRPCCRLTTYH